ncbi:MAG: nicotinate-nucleotide adenylyltransferase [Gemmataceae bacterium]|nr:nicotinate-nucleotide adenylyltransferase [Gemmataceae bacterium]
MRIGVFGGTFDPVHLGHLIVAEQCREQARLDQVLFIPAARPPHKLDRELTRFDQRVDMLNLAIAGHPAFRVDELERDRPGPSFTYATLEELHRREPATEWCLILGGDSLADLASWAKPRRILELATLLVVPRPGTRLPPLDALRQAVGLPPDDPLRLQIIAAPLIDIASRDLRRRVAEGRSVRYQLPRAVEAYIADKGLYRR